MPHNPYKVFHSLPLKIRDSVHVVLVKPELPANVGAAARAMANMDIKAPMRIVGSPNVINSQSYVLAKHARDLLDSAIHYDELSSCLNSSLGSNPLKIAASARVGSSKRPHPLLVREAIELACAKHINGEITDLVMVFGPEGDGLTNEDIELCDWIGQIPSSQHYSSLNLAQSVLIFCYEVNSVLLRNRGQFVSAKPSQRERLVLHFLEIAETSGFILPGDPHKMKPRLERLLSVLPNYIEDAKTLHGLLDQIGRSVKKGEPDFKGRYRREMVERGILES